MSQYDPKLVRFCIDIYIRVSYGGHNLDIFYTRKLKFGVLLTQTYTFNSVLELPLDHTPGLG